MLLLYGITLGTSAFLLFLVQPMVGKAILPLYGGTPAIWTACMLFFQAILLFGYLYSHLSLRWLPQRAQVVVHLSLVFAVLFLLPIGIGAQTPPPPDWSPVSVLLLRLLAAVGLPLFLVSATGPMLQRWFTHTGERGSQDPYFLYASSNVGSLAALLAYPLLFEPLMELHTQNGFWTALYAGLFLLLILCAAPFIKKPRPMAPSLTGDAEDAGESEGPEIDLKRRLFWLFAAFLPSSLMLGATAYITTTVAVIPLFWVLPLALYLLTFIISFSRRPLIPHRWVVRLVPAVVLCLGPMVFLKFAGIGWLNVACHLTLFFVVALFCHGELVRSRPSSRYLTEFYLWLAIGGVAGGVFNAIIAPSLFSRILEYPLVLLLASTLIPAKRRWGSKSGFHWLDLSVAFGLFLFITGMVAVFGLAGIIESRLALFLLFGIPAFVTYCVHERPWAFVAGLAVVYLTVGAYGELKSGQTLHMARNFFGLKRVLIDSTGTLHHLTHGATIHGTQFLDPDRRGEATAYYHASGPVGDLFLAMESTDASRTIGTVGLGAGAVATYARPGDHFVFYEIDPQVATIARDEQYFRFLADCGPQCNVDIIDGRLGIASAADRSFDLILLDAFNSGTIPMHLLTREAIETYLAKLKEGGLIAFHISNDFVRLAPALAAAVDELGLSCLERDDRYSFEGKNSSHYLVLFRPDGAPQYLVDHPVWTEVEPTPGFSVWTDEYSDLLSAIRFNK
ncbi:MAG: fused MFS/spermidine synthase [Acidobacteriota bacterium]|nr:MAG: fused MFS/spermidine synthase [Acidobacteriota bacterium]